MYNFHRKVIFFISFFSLFLIPVFSANLSSNEKKALSYIRELCFEVTRYNIAGLSSMPESVGLADISETGSRLLSQRKSFGSPRNSVYLFEYYNPEKIGIIDCTFCPEDLYVISEEEFYEENLDAIENLEDLTDSFESEKTGETDEKIQSDISGLYSKLRNEESLTLLKRLEEEPQDVNNLFQILAARKLSPELFCHLRTAFCNLLELGDVANEDDGIHCSYRETFLILLCQHYMQNAVKDDRIRKELQSPLTLTKIINSEFKKDIIKTTQDLCLALCDNDCTFDKCGTLVIFLTALNDSKYSELSELKKIFEEKISDKNLLSDAIKKCEQNKNYIKLFGIIPQAEGTNS